MNTNEVVLPKADAIFDTARSAIDFAIYHISESLRSALSHIKSQHSILKPIVSLDDVRRHLADYFESKSDITSRMLASIFSNSELLRSVTYSDAHIQRYGISVAEHVSDHVKSIHSLDKEDIGLIWMLSSPSTIYASLAVISHETNKYVSRHLIEELFLVARTLYQLELASDYSLMSLYEIKPLLRQVELRERTIILLTCIEELRIRSSQNEHIDFISLSEGLQEISSFSYLSEAHSAYVYGACHAEEFNAVFSELQSYKGNIILQDQTFLGYVMKSSEKVVGLIHELTQKISSSKSEQEIRNHLLFTQTEIVFLFSSICILGREVYTIESIYKLLLLEYQKFFSRIQEDDLRYHFFQLFIPFTHTAPEEASGVSISPQLLSSMKFLYSYLKNEKGCSHESAIRCLMDAYPPLRFYKITSFLSEDIVCNDLYSGQEADLGYIQRSPEIIDYWVLKKEGVYIDTLLQELQGV